MADTAPTLVIGAGPAGLATAAALQMRGLPSTVLEAAGTVGSSWRGHYRRLHLHTPKAVSGLPGMPMPPDYPLFPSRQQVVDYLQAYAEHFEIQPRFGQSVTRVERENGHWRVHAGNEVYESEHVVVATGYNRQPHAPTWPGQRTFEGTIIHSREYVDGQPFTQQRVMVVGIGNTGGEICICLHEHDAAEIVLCVRSVVDVVPREFLGVPITMYSIRSRGLPLGLQDFNTSLVSRLTFGRLARFGLRPSGHPISRIVEEGKIPLIDVGTVDLVKRGRVRVVGAIERFTPTGVVTSEGEIALDAVILATGYRTGLADVLADADAVLDERGIPRRRGAQTELPGLFFVGFTNPPTGLLRGIGIEARRVADAIGTRVAHS